MTRSAVLTVMMLCSMVSRGQNISVSFTGTGASTKIDSVTATNLTTNQKVTLPGNETLVLTGNTGIPTIPELAGTGIVYPNPFSGQATLNTVVQNPQTVYLKLQNLVGQVVAQTKACIQPGENEFALFLNKAGIYMITLTTDQGSSGYKVICTEATQTENSIQYLGSRPNNHNNLSQSGLKSSQSVYSLGFQAGEIILYKCISGIYTTIVTDSPVESKNYEIEFAACTDLDGKNYSIVKIGYQTWMAENLAYLPSASPSSVGSGATSNFYVYGYQGSSVGEAKATNNYSTYGVLYNWEAAKTTCPSGWYLPSDEDWKILEKNLGMSNFDAGLWEQNRSSGSVGGKLKETETAHWLFPNTGATNASGFTALPGGYLHNDGPQNSRFSLLGVEAYFWSAAEHSTTLAYNRKLSNSHIGILRSPFSDKGSGYSARCLKIGPAPMASFTFAPPVGAPSTSFQFDASGCTDPETPARDLEVRWDWNGDGNWDTRYDTIKTNSFQYPDPGNYSVILEVKDADGFVDTETKMVIVGDGSFTDSRDGEKYIYKNYGTQTWLIENLAFLPFVSPSSSESEGLPYYYVYNYEGTNIIDAKTTTNYSTYGALYNWEAAKTACPSGWHLPNNAEWTLLTDYLTNNGYGYEGSGNDIGKSMAATSGWSDSYEVGTVGNDQASNNRSGFSVLPGGARTRNGDFGGLGTHAGFWSSSEEGAEHAWGWGLSSGLAILIQSYDYFVHLGMSVRCLKGGLKPIAIFTISPESGTVSTNFQFDASGSTDHETDAADLLVRWDWNGDGTWDTDFGKAKTSTCQYPYPGDYSVILEVKDGEGLVSTITKTVFIFGSITDNRDGHEYLYKSIGTQTWMIENLAYLPSVSPSSNVSATLPKNYVYAYDGNQVVEAKGTDNYTTYGVLYNWEAAKNACPSGWHLPADAEWKVLETFLGMSQSDANSPGWRNTGGIGKKLKSNTYWNTGNLVNDNSSRFTALPGGALYYSRGFNYLGDNAYFWSASDYNITEAWSRVVDKDNDGAHRSYWTMQDGFSVRCLRD